MMTRPAFNRLSQAIFLLVLLVVVDICIGAFGPPNLFRLARGQTVPVSGDLNQPPIVGARMGDDPDPATVQEVLGYKTDSQGLNLVFLELKGRVWRGELTAADLAEPGEYTLTVFNAAAPGNDPERIYSVRLFHDQAALRADLPTVSQRWLGVRPLWLFLGLLPLALVMLFFSYLRTGDEEKELQARGIGSIYKLARRKTGWEIIFGLGSEHGVHPGDRLQILNQHLRPVGELTATRVGMDGTHATLPLDADIRPTYFVALLEDRTPPGLE